MCNSPSNNSQHVLFLLDIFWVISVLLLVVRCTVAIEGHTRSRLVIESGVTEVVKYPSIIVFLEDSSTIVYFQSKINTPYNL